MHINDFGLDALRLSVTCNACCACRGTCTSVATRTVMFNRLTAELNRKSKRADKRLNKGLVTVVYVYHIEFNKEDMKISGWRLNLRLNLRVKY